MSVAIITKKMSYDTGVIVSIRHLSKVLENAGIPHKVYYYTDEHELVNLVENCAETHINLQVPSFSDETLKTVISIGKPVMLSIHSTLCNMQVEEGMLGRVFCLGEKYGDRMLISCPSERETLAMNSFNKGRFVWLPNTFSYAVPDETEVLNRAERISRDNVIKVGLFCAYRPLKNIPVQIAALQMLSKKYSIELHMFEDNPKNPLYTTLIKMLDGLDIKYILRKQADNASFYSSIDDITLGMQVSLSETFSYVAIEHMSRGIPFLGSQSIPFSTLVADYSDVNDISEKADKLMMPGDYKCNSLKSYRLAKEIIDKNSHQAVTAITDFLKV